jgi:hypothetical protein
VTQFVIGQCVAGLDSGGAAAQLVSIHENFVFARPDSVSYEIGAGLPVNYLSAHFALKLRGGLQAGETVLVHGAPGGVGTPHPFSWPRPGLHELLGLSAPRQKLNSPVRLGPNIQCFLACSRNRSCKSPMAEE